MERDRVTSAAVAVVATTAIQTSATSIVWADRFERVKDVLPMFIAAGSLSTPTKKRTPDRLHCPSDVC